MNTRRWSTFTLSALACAMVATPALAQASQTTGAVRGAVKAKKGGSVAGAMLTLRNTETGFVRTIQSDPGGNYVFSLVPLGDYELNVTATGLKSLKRTALTVTLGNTTIQNFDMDSAEATAVVEVVAQAAAIDATQVNSVTAISTDQVERIPLAGRNFTDLLLLTPGVSQGGNAWEFSVEGGRSVQNNLQIDGSSYNSRFSGEQRGGTRAQFTFSQDSIRELQVITNSFDAQYGDSNGAIINAVSKTGTNEFRGSAFILFRPDSLAAKVKPVPYERIPNTTNAERVRTREFSQFQVGFNVGGPLIKDKLHYFVNAEYVRYKEQSVPAFGTDTGTGNEQAAFDAFWAAGGFASRVVTSNNGKTLLQESQSPWTNTQKTLTVLGRLDWSLSQDHRLTFRANYQNYDGSNNVYSFRRADVTEGNNSRIHYYSSSVVAELSSVFGANWLNEGRIQWASERRPVVPNTNIATGMRVSGTSGTLFTAGQNFNDPRTTEEKTLQIQDTLSYVSGDWNLKGGFDLQKTEFENQFLSGSGGSFTFGSYAAANFWYSNPASWPTGTPGNGFDRRVRYEQSISPVNGFAVFDNTLLQAFVQAQYTGLLDHRLMLNLGFRHTSESWSRNESPNPALAGTDEAADSSSLDPRFGFSYDLKGDARTVIRGGWGKFTVSNRAQNIASTIQQNGINTRSYQIDSYASGSSVAPNAALFAAGGLLSSGTRIQGNSIRRLTAADFAGLSGVTPDILIIDPESKMARAEALTLGVEHDLGNGLVVGLKGTYKKLSNLQYWIPINLWQSNGPITARTFDWYQDGWPTTTNSWTTRTFTSPPTPPTARPGKAIVRGRLLDLSAYGETYLSKTDGEGLYRSLTFTVAKSSRDGWSFNGNFTVAKSEDVNTNELSRSRGTLANSADPMMSYGPSDYDRLFRAVLAISAPPTWGIRTSGYLSYSSGRPFTATFSSDVNGDNISGNDTPWGRNTLRQPDEKLFNLRFSRNFSVSKALSLEGIIDVFNVFNWANQVTSQTAYASGATSAVNASFGRIDRADNRSREVQFTLKARF